MTHKVIIGILVFLAIFSGSLGYYSYTLNQQIGYLNEKLIVFQEEQVTWVAAVSGALTNLRGETLTQVGNLKDGIDKTLTKINSIEDEIDGTQTRIVTLEDKTDETLDKIDALTAKISDATGELTQSVINASEVYQKVSLATVMISNGETTIGSGFIFDNHGHVVTAQHVVDNLSTIYVVLPDGRLSEAISTGSCQISDVAVLRLEDELDGVEPSALADSAKVRIGEPVAVIGTPFDLTGTLTTGIVSQIDRFAEIQYDAQSRRVPNLIQFDAAVNYGNSGGPLFNSEGEIIGLVIARVNPNDGDGIYYAVSANKVKRVVDELIIYGSFDYPWIGVTVSNLTPQAAQTRDLETTNGALVGGINPDGPAEVAGIKVDDIIVAIDGVNIRDVAGLTSYLGEYKSPGEAATITLIRGNSEMELSLEIGKRQT